MGKGFRVSLNGDHLLSVATDALDMLDVHVNASKTDEPMALYDIHGFVDEGGEADPNPWWALREELRLGDELTVEFLQDVATSRPPDPPYPEDDSETPFEMPSPEQVVEDLKKRPIVHNQLRFRFTGVDGVPLDGGTTGAEIGYAFSFRWMSMRPEQVRVSLHCYDADYLTRQKESRDLVLLHAPLGSKVAFKVL